MKEVVWLGRSKRHIQRLPTLAKLLLGEQLRKVQKGEHPSDWKPLPNVGTGVAEIRIHRPQEYRLLYVASEPLAIYVLHVFAKTTNATPLLHLQIARSNYAKIKKG